MNLCRIPTNDLRHNFNVTTVFSHEQQELLRSDGVELKFWRRHFGAIRTADGSRMGEKVELPLDAAILSNGVVEEKSVVAASCFSVYVWQLSRSLN
jgi:hypothetical protein